MKIVLIVLGWYLDLVVYLTLSALTRHFLSLDLAWGTLADLAVFVPLRLLAMQLMTPGQWLLGVAATEREDTMTVIERQWPNLLIGSLLFLEGTKRMVRWIDVDQPLPFMGVIPEGSLYQGGVGICLGLMFVVSGAALLRMEPVGRWVGFFAIGVTGVSTALSWGMWDTVVARVVVARRAAQGISVRAGEIEFMQMLFPELLVAGMLGSLLLLLLCRTSEG